MRFSIPLGLVLITCVNAQGQVIPDGTTNTNVSSADRVNFIIQSGNSGFHSFSEFSVPDGGSATFMVSPTVPNIFSRVTGQNLSRIEGLLSVSNSNANLFLLNPNGIIFGSNASLDLNGSFLATTGDRFIFRDGSFFSATETTAPLPLTIDLPVGLQFGANPGEILSQANIAEFGFAIGLTVTANQSLILAGGNVSIEGFLTAPGGTEILFSEGGNIEIASLGTNALIGISDNLQLEYSQDNNFQTIDLLNNSIINVAGGGAGGGSIRLQARKILGFEQAAIEAFNFGSGAGGSIKINATDSIILNNSIIRTSTLSNGDAGNIQIATETLILNEETLIDAASAGLGNGGNITIDTSTTQLNTLSRITNQTFGVGNAGTIDLNTNILSLNSGSQIVSSSFARGNGGQVNINASGAVTFNGSGVQPLLGTVSRSGVLSESVATGTAGEIDIMAQNLTIEDGALVSAQANSGNGGNIALNLGELLVLEDGEISAAALGDGGNITIDGGIVTALPGSSNAITANAFEGIGGNVTVSANALLGSSFLDITASSAFGLDGTTSLTEEVETRQQIDPLADRVIPVSEGPRQGCPAPGGEARFTSQALRPLLPEAQGWIAQGDGSIVLTHDPTQVAIDRTLTMGQGYEKSEQWKKARAVYEAAIDNGYENPELYAGLIRVLFELEPNQENLKTVLEIHGELKLTELEDLLNCGDIRLTSVYELDQKADAIVTIIELAKELIAIVSLPNDLGYHHELALKIPLSEIELPLSLLSSVLKVDNISSIELEDFILEPARKLYYSLIPDIQAHLPESGTLLFVINGRLESVPIALLQDSNNSLIENYAITQTSMPHIYTGSSNPIKILAAGVSVDAPSYDQLPGEANALPFVSNEIEFIKNLDKRNITLLDKEFTVNQFFDSLQNELPSVVHIAAHGRYGVDTFLTAYDNLINLDDFYRLVRSREQSENTLELLVLSACRTAQGDDRASLGLAGIAVRAGVKSTLASAWVVNDHATSALMQEFYQAWIVEGMTKVEALRKAQLKIREVSDDPRFWAGFFLSGDWN